MTNQKYCHLTKLSKINKSPRQKLFSISKRNIYYNVYTKRLKAPDCHTIVLDLGI